MTESDKVWPPAPNAGKSNGAAGTPTGKSCPHCGRKLLTQTSALCNWCGVKIDDAEYQEQAAQTRLERDAAERAALEAALQEEAAAGGPWNRLRRKGKSKAVGGGELKP